MTGRDKRNTAGIGLGFYNDNEWNRKTKKERDVMQFYAVTIYTKELLLRSEYETLIF